jgi:hypothetical protein
MNKNIKKLLLSSISVNIKFSPKKIGGLLLWYDFSDPTTLFQDAARSVPVDADGDVIGGVTDKSGLANHGGQAVTAAKPIYKTGALSLGGADASLGNFITYPDLNLSGFTVFFVMKFKTLINYSRWINSSGNADYIRHEISGAVALQTGGGGARIISPNSAIVSNAAYIMSVGYSSNLFLHLNGGANLAGVATETGDMLFRHLFGNFQNQPLTMGEYILYSGLLSDSNRMLVRDYLNAKWAVY